MEPLNIKFVVVKGNFIEFILQKFSMESKNFAALHIVTYAMNQPDYL